MSQKFICPLIINIWWNEWLIDVVSKNKTLFHFYDVTVIAQSKSLVKLWYGNLCAKLETDRLEGGGGGGPHGPQKFTCHLNTKKNKEITKPFHFLVVATCQNDDDIITLKWRVCHLSFLPIWNVLTHGMSIPSLIIIWADITKLGGGGGGRGILSPIPSLFRLGKAQSKYG